MYITINSTQNANVKLAKSLLQRKNRVESQLFLVEGKRSVIDVLKTHKPHLLFVLESVFLENKTVLSLYLDKVFFVTNRVMQYISDTQTSQGIVGIFSINMSKPITCDSVLYLEHISDPGNLGTIIRTAAAFGFLDIVLDNCVDCYNPKVVRSSMSGFGFVNFCHNQTIYNIKRLGYQIICADIQGKPIDDYSPMPNQKVCIVLGNEANGLSQSAKSSADILLSIPISNVESLNVSIAAGIIMQKLRTK